MSQKDDDDNNCFLLLKKRYSYCEKLGSGSFGTVYRYTDKFLNCTVALKMHDKASSSRGSFDREIQNLKRAQHCHVVRIHEVYRNRYLDVLVLEDCCHGDFFGIIKKGGPLTEIQARFYFFQLLKGLAAIHSSEVCHRDIKPENLLLDGAGDLKIADFDLSASFRDRERPSFRTCCGTLEYLAPEILILDRNNAMSRYDGLKADAWSASVCLFVMSTGVLPFPRGAVPASKIYSLYSNRKLDRFWNIFGKQGEHLTTDMKLFLTHALDTCESTRPLVTSHLESPSTLMNFKNAGSEIKTDMLFRLFSFSERGQATIFDMEDF